MQQIAYMLAVATRDRVYLGMPGVKSERASELHQGNV